MRKSEFLFFVGVMLLAVLGNGALGCGKQLGMLRGSVTFSGLPCTEGQADFKTPPCTGPYPGYEVEVYQKSNLLEPLSTTTTDNEGIFNLVLEPGEYVIRSQDGVDKRNNQKNTAFVIEKDELTTVTIRINTGMQ